MTIKIRRLIFYSLIAAFVVLAFIIIPYSNGWVFNFKTFTFAQLGGIYLEVDPSDSLISVDGLKVQIKPSFFRNGVLVANLFPKTYHVSVTKQNYQFWNGGVAVSPSLVTQIHPIVLLPEKLQKNIIANNVKSIFLNSNILAFEDKNNSIKVSGKSIRGTEFVSWLSGDTFIITFDKNTGNYFATNVNDHTALNINLIFNNLKNQRSINDTSKISNVGAYPADGNKVILTTSKSIYALDINKISLKVIKPGRYDLLATENGKIYFSDSQNIYSYDIGTQMMSTLAPETASVAELSPDGHFFAFSNEN
ncbi:MAG: hypothetical protein M1155_01945, partial [Patescibacteria group bacterium]|nr:hypothetical protein [Patescibacteria group bacterium]